MSPGPPGTWRPGAAPADRQFIKLSGLADGGLGLEYGARLPEVVVAYETWGTLNPDHSNGVLVLHALTGDSHASGPAGPGHPTAGWWAGLIGPGLAIDTDRFFVVCPNVLGGCQGTTGPSSAGPDGVAYGSRFPLITIRDQVAVEAALADAIGIAEWSCVIGGSMGGMRALEWCVEYPARVGRAIVLAVGAAATADQIALCSLQIRAIRNDPDFASGDYYARSSGPVDGLSLARGIGQVTYRTTRELESRFGRNPQAEEDLLKGGRFAVESYLEHHGEKLADRFDPNSYIVLSEAMNHHDLGRGRGGIARALGGVQAEVQVAGIASDRLYPLELQEDMAQMLPGNRPLCVVESMFGHDGFLLEIAQIGEIIHAVLRG
jgi:homoserine O-acetyltransferase/O-succinyltransferase